MPLCARKATLKPELSQGNQRLLRNNVLIWIAMEVTQKPLSPPLLFLGGFGL